MARGNEEELLNFKVGLDVTGAKKSVLDFNKRLKETLSLPLKLERIEKKALKSFQNDIKKSTRGVNNMKEALLKASRVEGFGSKAKRQYKELASNFKEVGKSSDLLRRVVEKNEASILKAKRSGDKVALAEAQKAAQKEIRIAKGAYNMQRGVLANKAKRLGVGKSLSKQGRNSAAFDTKEIAADVKSGLSDGFHAFMSKDGPGLAGGIAKLMGGAVRGLGKGGMGLAGLGSKLMGKGAAMSAKKGAGNAAGGAAIGAIGAMSKSLGGVLQVVGKLGPLLSAASGIIVGIVKFMVDIEATGKQINRELLEGASTADILAKSGYNTSAGYEDLSKTLQTIKDQASDVQMNLDMGTTAKDHLAVINVLKREGVSLGALNDQLKMAQDSSDAGVRSVSHFSDVTKMSIGYSRLLGVSIDEIGQMQAEMMTDMGESLSDTKLEFSRMTDAAAQSGIAANKFFGIIRGVSADLSLYGMRLKDVTRTMGLLGKTMSPRTAQKFMQSIVGAFKGKSMVDRLRTAIIAGPGAGKAAQKDIDEKMKDVLSTVQKRANLNSPEEAKALLEGGTVKRTNDKGQEVDMALDEIVKDSGALVEAYETTKMRQKQLGKGDSLGTAAAMEDMGPTGTAKIIKDAMLKFSGKKDLSEMTPMDLIAAEQGTGYDQEQIRQTMLFYKSMEKQRALLKRLFDRQKKKTLSKEDEKTLQRAVDSGVTDSGMVDSLDEYGVMNSMGETDDEKAQKQADDQLKVAWETGKLSQSMLDKLDVLIDYVFNLLYKTMMGIWKSISHLVIESDKDKQTRLDQEVMGLSKDLGAAKKKRADLAANNQDTSEVDKSITDINSQILDALHSMPKYSLGILGGDENRKKLDALNTEFDRLDATTNPASQAAQPQTAQSQTAQSQAGVRMGTTVPGLPPVDKQPVSTEQAEKHNDATVEATNDVATTITTDLRKRGVKIDKSFLENDFGNVLEKSVLEGMRQALFEYYLYKDDSIDKTMKAMQAGGVSSGKGYSTLVGNNFASTLGANATGGMVTGIKDGIASISPAPGEGLASIGSGEKIVPANGGGGSNVMVNVNGPGAESVAAFLKPKIVEAIQEYDRRRKYT